jgi:hypothetical protein
MYHAPEQTADLLTRIDSSHSAPPVQQVGGWKRIEISDFPSSA